ncbi:cysteine hydrolase family protein [Furfurilactobacillus siliginis]|uniref:Amidase n=1 Tax=Furfurilactobacillus siliginis TaxID=348151 RepID=A0A0R2LGM9_9LACO|nr:cysteine hydrolase family protein [Furfurilactobacillus siliginis]KRN97188.1 hypothetical protein IV55_GL000110 [Furfurilactobacillus siliginis]GEK28650.1 amidase [Furfurilactobacillus siliginis]
MKKALLVVDMQTDVIADVVNRDQLLININDRIEQFRQQHALIIFIQHEDSDLVHGTVGWQLSPSLSVTDTDIVMPKTHADSFYHTPLQELLTQHQITDLEICGAQTNYCLDTTIRVAFDRLYNITVGADMYSTVDNDFMTAEQTNAYYRDMWDQRFAKIY